MCACLCKSFMDYTFFFFFFLSLSCVNLLISEWLNRAMLDDVEFKNKNVPVNGLNYIEILLLFSFFVFGKVSGWIKGEKKLLGRFMWLQAGLTKAELADKTLTTTKSILTQYFLAFGNSLSISGPNVVGLVFKEVLYLFIFSIINTIYLFELK